MYGPGQPHRPLEESDGDDPAGPYHTNRTTRIQRISFNADGSPNLGQPLALGATQDLPAGDPGPSTFTGTQLGLLSVRDTGNGIAAISVDNGAEQRLDFYGAIRVGEALNYLSPAAGVRHAHRPGPGDRREERGRRGGERQHRPGRDLDRLSRGRLSQSHPARRNAR